MSKVKRLVLVALIAIMVVVLSGCTLQKNNYGSYGDVITNKQLSNNLASNLPVPADIYTSLSRENLIRRAYFLAGDMEKARNYPSKVSEKPLGYIYLFLEGVGCVARDTVDGIPTSMRSYLTPDTSSTPEGRWLADVDGTYGENPDGIFWFDANGMYHEWVGIYYYSDTYYDIDDPIININVEGSK